MTPEKTETEKINIGLASYNQSDTYINELVSCFKEECNRLETNQHKISVTVQDAKWFTKNTEYQGEAFNQRGM